jgi:hypothetical protein
MGQKYFRYSVSVLFIGIMPNSVDRWKIFHPITLMTGKNFHLLRYFWHKMGKYPLIFPSIKCIKISHKKQDEFRPGTRLKLVKQVRQVLLNTIRPTTSNQSTTTGVPAISASLVPKNPRNMRKKIGAAPGHLTFEKAVAEAAGRAEISSTAKTTSQKSFFPN